MRGVLVAAAIVMGAGMLAGGGDARAAEGGAAAAKSKFYIFDPDAFTGQVKGPGTELFGARRAVRFERLARLKRSFVRELMDSGRDASLR